MAIGGSGRIVVEIDPELKRQFHAALKKDGTNFKHWLLENIAFFLDKKLQPAVLSDMSSVSKLDINHEI